jgi:predicted nucleotidyltransferase
MMLAETRVIGKPTTPTLADIARVLGPLLPPGYRAVLFGSRATGQGAPRSDWDIGIVGPEPLSGALLERLRDSLDGLPTLHSFDVVDLAAAAPEFRRLALARTVEIA